MQPACLVINLKIDLDVFSDGWIDAEHLGCFKFLHWAVSLSWVEAQAKCETEGGYLAEPKTQGYNYFVCLLILYFY